MWLNAALLSRDLLQLRPVAAKVFYDLFYNSLGSFLDSVTDRVTDIHHLALILEYSDPVIIEAKDLDDAIAVAKQIPPASKGTIEIRPVMEIPGLPNPVAIPFSGEPKATGWPRDNR